MSLGEWRNSKISEVLVPQGNKKKVQQGWSPRCLTRAAEAGEWGVLKTTAIQAGHFEPQYNKALPPMLSPKPAIEVLPGDLLITCAGPRSRCGVPALVRSTPGRLMMSGKMYRFRPTSEVDSRFLELWLLSPDAQSSIDDMKTGISESGLNLTHSRFLELIVPVPPVDEQRRIVGILEDHLARLDAAGRSISRARQRLASLRSSALERGFSSKLTGVALGELVESIEAGRSFGSSSSPAADDEWGIIKVSAMTWGEFRASENKRVPSGDADPRFEIHDGDLLVSRANTSEYVGASVLVRSPRPRLLLSDKSLRLTPRPKVNSEWLWRALQTPTARRQISELATGTKDSMRNISQKSLLQVLLPDTEFGEQATAVGRFREVSQALERIEAELRRAEIRHNSLRRSLLGAAFSGRLTGHANDSDQIEELASTKAIRKGRGNDA